MTVHDLAVANPLADMGLRCLFCENDDIAMCDAAQCYCPACRPVITKGALDTVKQAAVIAQWRAFAPLMQALNEAEVPAWGWSRPTSQEPCRFSIEIQWDGYDGARLIEIFHNAGQFVAEECIPHYNDYSWTMVNEYVAKSVADMTDWVSSRTTH